MQAGGGHHRWTMEVRKGRSGRTLADERSVVRSDARLLRCAKPPGASWRFVVLSPATTARMLSRGLVAIVGTLNGHASRATLEPDGQKAHGFKVSARLRAATGTAAGDAIVLEIPLATSSARTRSGSTRIHGARGDQADARGRLVVDARCTISAPAAAARNPCRLGPAGTQGRMASGPLFPRDSER